MPEPHAEPPAVQPAEPPATLDVAAVDRYVEARIRASRIPGASLAIVRNGKTNLVRSVDGQVQEFLLWPE